MVINMLKKIEYTKSNLLNEKIENIFICPICHSNIRIYKNSLICEKNHCYDIAKKGYFTLLKKNKLRIDNIYDINLFKNRMEFIKKGFYCELHKLISKIIIEKGNSQVIVDMGCGDGTHDNMILNLISNSQSFIIGVDISKVGVECATDYVKNNFIPLVADLNYMPLENKSVDVILNILSPSNEKEMNRILKQDGIIIKVTPKKEYLYELRELLHIKEYENELQIEKNIDKNYIILKKYTINERKELNEESMLNLINMTPLSKNYNYDKMINEITIALNIYVLKVMYKIE